MRPVFLDTVGVIALLNRSDQWRPAALEAYEKLRKERREFLATTFVLLEAGNAVARTPLRGRVFALASSMSSEGRLITPDESDWEQAWRAYETAHAGGPSIVDCVSFQIMRRLGLSEVFTNDAHFAAAGFRPLF
ncbi:hypothetical protein Mal64_32870 [Pseudobythopirellula maris]|uniref:PIN domain-containing protein n=1 Tax=Pseudobythopirellula maris TaxID=2527991 RepID=A0A5C5ZK00_9BACT|nr:PIN domain-containing protein [Pseudobythopirellula maris]TWT87744.1 hypothetical protein Mal64_32870 [Pseudobythopirellula maris]